MSCSTLIGVTASGGAYAARWLHWGGDPAQVIPPLRRIWQHTFTRHTLATAEALLRGYTDHGHRWSPANLWLPETRAGLDAEVCLAAHPHGAPVLRFTHPTAHATTATAGWS